MTQAQLTLCHRATRPSAASSKHEFHRLPRLRVPDKPAATTKTHSLDDGYPLPIAIMMPSTPPILLKKTEVCERLNLSARSLEGMVKAGTFPPAVLIGKFAYWSETAITSWLSRRFGPQEAWRP